MSILSIFKTNRKKIAEQETKIIEQREKLDEAQSDRHGMEAKLKSLKQEVTTKEDKIHDLGKEIDRIESKKTIQIDKMKSDRKIHDEQMEHLVKIKTESLVIEHDKKVVDLQREKNEEVAEIRDEYRDKIEKNLEDRIVDLKDQTTKVMEFIPKVESMVSISQGNQLAASKD